MSRYITRLKALLAENSSTRQTDKTDRGAFVGFVGDQGRHVSVDDSAETHEGDSIVERAALAADGVPACYLDGWARLQCQRPFSMDLRVWRSAINDAGLFLDAWGADAAALQWRSDELFSAPREGRAGGLIWRLRGLRVENLGASFAILGDGRRVQRATYEG